LTETDATEESAQLQNMGTLLQYMYTKGRHIIQQIYFANQMTKMQKGFTLIELLVVLAIVAILSVVVILTLNPGELLKQSRDSNRISDFSTMKSALSLYLSDVSSPNLGTSTNCYVSTIGGFGTTVAKCGGWFTNGSIGTTVSTTQPNYRKVDGNGWIPVVFTNISSGAPVGNLPIDPVNSATLFYAYAATNVSSSLTFELATLLESAKYLSVMANDGGASSTVYEAGTFPGLNF
jgi:prepilin-type N-terminal cleavage/methylation domain-containing protein